MVENSGSQYILLGTCSRFLLQYSMWEISAFLLDMHLSLLNTLSLGPQIGRHCVKEAPYSFQLCSRNHVFIGQLHVSYFCTSFCCFFRGNNSLQGRFLGTFPGSLSSNVIHIIYIWKTFYFSENCSVKVLLRINLAITSVEPTVGRTQVSATV